MALTFNDVVDRARAVAPEVPQATVVSFANERVGRMVSESEYRTKIAALGVTTVAGQSNYAMDADTVDIRAVYIGTNKYVYGSWDQINEVVAGRADIDTRDGKTGIFTWYSTDGQTQQLYLYPAPSTTGTSITVIESLHPSDSVYSGTDNLAAVVPKHLRPYVLDGTLADVYEFTGRWDESQNHEARFSDGIDKLRRLKNTRTGSGVGRVTLIGPGRY